MGLQQSCTFLFHKEDTTSANPFDFLIDTDLFYNFYTAFLERLHISLQSSFDTLLCLLKLLADQKCMCSIL
jgi:hypothetical protein